VLRAERDGVSLAVKVTPRARRPGIEGLVAGAPGPGAPAALLQVRVAAAPEDGKANAAVIDLLAAGSGLPRRAFSIVAGATDRTKRIHVAGDPAAILPRLRTLVTQRS